VLLEVVDDVFATALELFDEFETCLLSLLLVPFTGAAVLILEALLTSLLWR
jgi:hypothetical protein